MISDLLTIVNAIQNASDSEEKIRLESDLLEAVQTDIRAHFEDTKYPQRRRSFKTIRRALGIFDEDPQRLREILYAMGARPVRGEGEDATWHLPAITTNTTKRRGIGFSRIYFILGLIAAVVSFIGFFGLNGAELMDFLFLDLEKCLERSGTNFVEANLCNEKYSG